MPKPVPQNCRVDPDGRGVAFDADVQGKRRSAIMTFEALDEFFPHVLDLSARLRLLVQRSYIVDLVAQPVRAGDDAEPICVSSLDVSIPKPDAKFKRGR